MYLQNKVQLFLLHFAGGSCYSYEFLKKNLRNDFEFYSLELPGRGRRNNEKFLLEKKDAVEDYFNQIKKLRNNKPYIIYGHSMGATLGLSVSKRMQEIGDAPQSLIVSGNPGPTNEKRTIKRYLLEDYRFKEELRKLGGVPDEILVDEELYSFFSPIMRADFEILEKDNFSEKGLVIQTPIYALMGDEEDTCAKITNWNRFTSSGLQSKILDGGHFFIYDHPKEIAEVLIECINLNNPSYFQVNGSYI
jgi:surfactin synthase thioesterase subunit